MENGLPITMAFWGIAILGAYMIWELIRDDNNS